MARVAPRVPELTEILCSQCGYVLDGLPASGNCPECGKPIIESIGSERVAPLWESSGESEKLRGFLQTTLMAIVSPARFYRTFTVQGPLTDARQFAVWHWWICAGLFGLACAIHTAWYTYLSAPAIGNFSTVQCVMFAGLVIGLTVLTYLALDGITRLAARLTSWEATYRGHRLPYPIVLRGMYYHAAHYLPVAAGALLTVGGYQLLVALVPVIREKSPAIYLYVLSAQVVLSAIYLFQTYWIGMRNMMFANR